MRKVKKSSLRLRTQSSQFPAINTTRFKDSFVNRLIFKYNLKMYCILFLLLSCNS